MRTCKGHTHVSLKINIHAEASTTISNTNNKINNLSALNPENQRSGLENCIYLKI